MGKGHRTCEICGISERHNENSLLFSSFPLEPNRCRAWLKVVGKEDLVYLPIEKLHKTRNVCAKHFEKKHFNKKGNRLKRDAIPTLNLMAAPLAESHLKEFPQHLYQPTEPKDLLLEAEPSTSQEGRSVLGELSQNEPSTSEQDRSVLGELSQNDLLEVRPSTSQQSRSILEKLSQNERTHSKAQKRPAGEVPTHKAKVIKLSQDKFNLTPREKKLMEQLRQTKCTLASLRRSANIIEKLESDILKEIVTSAIKNQKRKPKGRRWTAKNKISALAIFKRSPKAYRYLQNLMLLPSVKTLHNILKNKSSL